jgi:hypothetical protein
MSATKVVCILLALFAVFMAAGGAGAGGGVNVSVPVPRISVPVPRISVPKVTVQIPKVTVRSIGPVNKWGPRSPVGPTGGSAFLQAQPGTAPYYSGGASDALPRLGAAVPGDFPVSREGLLIGGASGGRPLDSGGASGQARYYAPASYSGNPTACGHYPYPRCR